MSPVFIPDRSGRDQNAENFTESFFCVILRVELRDTIHIQAAGHLDLGDMI